MRKDIGYLACVLGLLLSTVASAADTAGEMKEAEWKPWQKSGVLAALADPNREVRRFALVVLAERPFLEAKPYIVGWLFDSDSGFRSAAIEAIGKLGEHAKDQIPKLGGLLKDPDPGVRRSAAEALGRLGEHARDQASKLGELLKDPDVSVRQRTAEALGRLGEHAKDQAPKLGELLKDAEADVRRSAAEALGRLGGHAKDQAPKFVELLKDANSDVRRSAAEALGRLGEHAKDQAPKLVELLKDAKAEVCRSAAEALGQLGEHAKGQVPKLGELLKDREAYVRFGAAEALGRLGELAKDQAPKLGGLLRDPEAYVRFSAAEALGRLGEHAKGQVPTLGELLKDPEAYVRRSAAEALGRLGGHAKGQVPRLGELLKDPDRYVRRSAAEALGGLGEHAKDQAPRLGELLKDPDVYVRFGAVEALGRLGEHAKDQAPRLGELLKDPDPGVRWSAADALARLGEHAKDQVPEVAGALKDTYAIVRCSAALALGELGEHAKDQAPKLVDLLKDSDSTVRNAAALALGNLGEHTKDQLFELLGFLALDEPSEWGQNQQLIDRSRLVWRFQREACDQRSTLRIVAHCYTHGHRFAQFRFYAHCFGGGEERNEVLIRWLGRPNARPDPGKDPQTPRELLSIFESTWELVQENGFPPGVIHHLRDELATRIADVARAKHARWTTDDREWMLRLAVRLAGRPEADTLDSIVRRIDQRTWQFRVLGLAAIHGTFWLLLIVAYPYSRPVQTVFFWNKWVRCIAGMLYVGLLLRWVPFLRRRLFAPFRRALLTQEVVDQFNAKAYFDESHVQFKQGGEIVTAPLPSVFDSWSGAVILEGSSGLGKTQFLLRLAERSSRVTAYLLARECGSGVIEAIQRRLQGEARDAKFLRDLIWGGGIDLCIDGLNEVAPETRAKILHFAGEFSRGNILIATQPLSPAETIAAAKTYVLQPLSDEAALRFLQSRYELIGETDGCVARDVYERLCQDFLDRSRKTLQDKHEQETVQKTLSNPMDLTIAAQLIAATGCQIHVHGLMQQYYENMAADYQGRFHATFPLAEFAEWVYGRFVSFATSLTCPGEPDFTRELHHLEHHKMVLAVDGRRGCDKRQSWEFRHDKIREFFLVQMFLGEHCPKPVEHMRDPRFRGVYYLLADLLPLEKAEILREKVIDDAADSNDHSVSDEFVKRLRARRRRHRKDWNGDEPDAP